MKITCFMVMSIDGIIARNDREDVSAWSSKEDQRFFINKVKEYDAVITGRKSLNPKLLDMPTYLLTNSKNLYTDIPNIHCTNITELVEKLHKDGYENIALLGGPTTNIPFFKDSLVDDLYLTVEPIMMGSGLHFNGISGMEYILSHWMLNDYCLLNETGSFLLHYCKSEHKENTGNKHLLMDLKGQIKIVSDGETGKMLTNKKYWNERASIHAESDFYRIDELVSGISSLTDYEINELGDLKGKRIAHLQCHIGTETISLARLGAELVGLDYSEESIKTAEMIAHRCAVNCHFECANVYDASKILGEEVFDIIYVNFGALIMLPDLKAWCNEVVKLLKPDGFLYVNELHPIAATLSSKSPNLIRDYFISKANLSYELGSYSDGADNRLSKTTKNNLLFTWDWTLGDIVTTIAEHGLKLDFLHEHSGHVDKRYFYLTQCKNNKRWYSSAGIPNAPATFSLKAYKQKV